MKAVFHHELTIYFTSIRAYIFAAFLLLFTGIGCLLYNINASIANFEYVFGYISIVFVILVPILTMRSIAEERRQKTDQLLYSLPITSGEIILGKFFAIAVVFAIPMAVIATYPLIFSRYGDVYLPTAYGALIAFFFLGLALMSIGMFISSCTESQGIAAGVCIAVMLFIYYSDTLADYVSSTALGSLIALIVLSALLALFVRYLTKSDIAAIAVGLVLVIAVVCLYLLKPDLLENLLPNLFDSISLYTRFETFVNGVFDVTALVYDLTVMAFFLFLCVQSFEKRRYFG